MEKWKLGLIGLLLLGLVGYGVSQQKSGADGPTNSVSAPDVATPGATSSPSENKAAGFIGQTLGNKTLPEWTQVGPWENTPQALTLNSLKGKPSLVEFFRINCSHCQEAAPFLEMLYKRYKPRGLNMVAVQSPGDYKNATNDETQWPKVQAWSKAAGLTYPIAMDKGSAYFQKTIKGEYYPTTMLSDASGKVVHAQTGHDVDKGITLAVGLEKLLPGPGTPKARAQNLTKFLHPYVFGNSPAASPAMEKALADDIEQRLMGKV